MAKHPSVFITGNSRTGTTLMLALFGLSGAQTGYSKNQLLKGITVNPAVKTYDIRGGLDFYYNAKLRRRAQQGEHPEVFKHSYPLKKRGNSPLKIAELKGCKFPKVTQAVILYRELESNINSYVNMELGRARPHSYSSRAEALTQARWCYWRNEYKLRQQFPDAIWVEFPRYTEDFDYFYAKVGHLFLVNERKLRRLYDKHVSSGMVRH